MARRTLDFTVHDNGRTRTEALSIDECVVAGWTGRDAAAVEKHILELEALGVTRPTSTPIFYRVAAARLTTAEEIEVVGPSSSGEVEVVVVQGSERFWVGVGSDHTDREVETYGVTVSKQMCDKPVAKYLWSFEDVADHWDSLILRSFIVEGNGRSLYQEGSVANMLHPHDLIARYSADRRLSANTVMFCGTLPVRGIVRPGDGFDFELEDPIRAQVIRHRYAVRRLPIHG